MKSERRHELDTNILAIHVKEWIEKIRPYSRILSVIAIVAVGGAIISTYVATSATKKRELAWGEFTYALTSFPPQVESLQFAAEDHVGTPMEVWSNLTWADYQLANASRGFFRNRAEADKQIKSARAIYESLSERDDITGDILGDRARLGLARSLELNGDIEKAREVYEQVGGVFAQIAKSRSMALSDSNTQSTFTWLAGAVATTPRPPVGPGTPGEKPLFGTDFGPTPPGDSATPDGPLTPDSERPAPNAETPEESPIDFSLEDPEPAAEPAAETPDAQTKNE